MCKVYFEIIATIAKCYFKKRMISTGRRVQGTANSTMVVAYDQNGWEHSISGKS